MLPRTGGAVRRSFCWCWLVFLVATCGCMNQQLQIATRRTLDSLPGVQYQQVVDNLATIAANPGYLPYLAVVGQGSIQVTDNGNAALALSLSAKPIAADILNMGGSRNVTGTWSVGTITSPDKIRSMQALYHRTVLGATGGDPACAWLQMGYRRDVPKHACFVGRHERVCVWVMPDGMAGLSGLSLAIMDIATREDAVPPPAEPKEPLSQKAAAPSVPRRNFQVPPTGPVFTPIGN
jgi:hypothetical protein